MLRTGWFSSVYVKSVDTHRLKALLGARDQLVKLKRSLGNQVRGLLRPFGIKLPSRAGAKRFDEAAYQATRERSDAAARDQGSTGSLGVRSKDSRRDWTMSSTNLQSATKSLGD